MEVESYWRHFLRRANVAVPRSGNFTTNQYVRLRDPLHLTEFEVSLPRYPDVPPIRPFNGWARQPSPTSTITWYDAYNKTKHDRVANFTDGSLWNCIQAVAANVVLFCVRFGPFHLLNGQGVLASLFNQTFSIVLRDCQPESFYAPNLLIPQNQRVDLICFDSTKLIQARQVTPLTL